MKTTAELIDEIIELISEENSSITTILFKSTILAHNLQSPKFKEFIESEMKGYIGKELPESRKVYTVAQATILVQNFNERVTFPRVLPSIDENGNDLGISVGFREPISQLEKMAESEQEYKEDITDAVPLIYKWYLHPDWQVTEAHKIINKNSIKQIVIDVKYSILELLLEIRDEFKSNDYNDLTKIAKFLDDKVAQNININIINNNGDGNTVVQDANTRDINMDIN